MAKKKTKALKASKTKKTAKPRKAGPRSRPLPGMEQIRNRKLDNVCESIAEERAATNAAKLKEKQLTAAALQVMQAENVTVYKHAGVELVRVPGADKLRIRLVDDDGDAAVSAGTTSDSQSQAGQGQESVAPEKESS